jgi:hypothetical protein
MEEKPHGNEFGFLYTEWRLRGSETSMLELFTEPLSFPFPWILIEIWYG